MITARAVNTGKITQIIGPVVDVSFEGEEKWVDDTLLRQQGLNRLHEHPNHHVSINESPVTSNATTVI